MNADDNNDGLKGGGITRRHSLVEIAFLCMPVLLGRLGSKLQINQSLKVVGGGELYQEGKPPDVRNLSELGRAFLLANQNVVSIIPAKSNPFGPPGAISLPSRDAFNSIIKGLKFDQQVERTDIAPVNLTQSTSLFAGGPVPNLYARMMLGMGSGSPLLQILNPPDGGALPVMFDLHEPLRTGKTIPYSDGTGGRPDWGIIVQGQKVESPPEFLLITSIPNPYSPPFRLVFVAGRHGAGVRAIELVLRDERLLADLERKTQPFQAWQVLISVPQVEKERPLQLGEVRAFEIAADFDKLTKALEGKPLFSHPYLEALSGTLGLAKLVDLDAGSAARVAAESRGLSRPVVQSPEIAKIMNSPDESERPQGSPPHDAAEFVDFFIDRYGRELTAEEEKEILGTGHQVK